MKIRVLLTFSLLSLFSFQAVSEDCSKNKTYECLVKNSFDVYRSNPNRWWEIYRSGLNKAEECKTSKDVAIYLSLWGGQTDGEMAEGLFENTGGLILLSPSCFIDGLSKTTSIARNNLLSKFCPFMSIEEILEALDSIKDTPKNKDLIKAVRSRVIKCAKNING